MLDDLEILHELTMLDYLKTLNDILVQDGLQSEHPIRKKYAWRFLKCGAYNIPTASSQPEGFGSEKLGL